MAEREHHVTRDKRLLSEADRVAWLLALCAAPIDRHGECSFCGAAGRAPVERHAGDCPWRAAREYQSRNGR